MAQRIIVVGGGLAGSEAAWQAARHGVEVTLYEMRPVRMTPAHHTDRLAELVCTNSLGSNLPDTASGLLKEEMRRFDSIIIAAADAGAVPAGAALAVDREQFAQRVTERLASLPNVTIIREEMPSIPEEGPVVIATGPLTSESLSNEIMQVTGSEDLYFYDAAAPIVTAESVDERFGFWGARWGKGTADYFNCVLSKEEYEAFHQALATAERAQPSIEEDLVFFESCLPVEELAARGPDTLRYGPMRPVGLVDPRTGRRPYAVVQLRKENAAASLLNLVGFQNGAQVGRAAQGVPHDPGTALGRDRPLRRDAPQHFRQLAAGAASDVPDPCAGRPLLGGPDDRGRRVRRVGCGGTYCRNQRRVLVLGERPVVPPAETMLGSLARYITSADPEHFQPMNANFGLLPPLPERVRGKEARRKAQVERALEAISKWVPAVQPV